jgi:hypothetical protein
VATVTGLTADRMIAIEAASIVDGTINGTGHLILTKHDGTEIDAGSALVAVPAVNLVDILDGDSFTQVSPPESYPEGVSLMHLTSDQVAAGGWTNFAFKYGTIRTIKTGTNEIAQIWMHHHDASAEPELWIRGGNWNGWGTWRKLATTTYVDAADAVLDTRLDILEGQRVIPFVAETSPYSAYPLGVSNMPVGVGGSETWSRGAGSVTTYRLNEFRTYQIFNDNSHRLWTRRYHEASGGWGAWDQIQNDEVLLGGELTIGQWYRIATLPAGNAKASAEFVLSTDGIHNLVRIRASVVFNSSKSSLIVEECSGLDANSFVSRARLVGLNGTINGGHALDILIQSFTTFGIGSIRMAVKHDDWKGSSGALASNRWQSLSLLTTTPAVPVAPATVLMSRGVGYTGDYITPTLANGWVHWGSPFGNAGYKMMAGSVVHLRGLVKNGTVNGTAEIFTLPVGYRPDVQQLFVTAAGGGTLGRIDIFTDGRVVALAGNNGFMGLDGITFVATQ